MPVLLTSRVCSTPELGRTSSIAAFSAAGQIAMDKGGAARLAWPMLRDPPPIPLTQANAESAYEHVFSPWVKQLGLCGFTVEEGFVRARLTQRDEFKFFAGAMCGQALMSAIDVVVAMAMSTTARMPKSTIYQHTHFLRPAVEESFWVEAKVLRFGKASAFAEARVTVEASGELIAHACAEFAF